MSHRTASPQGKAGQVRSGCGRWSELTKQEQAGAVFREASREESSGRPGHDPGAQREGGDLRAGDPVHSREHRARPGTSALGRVERAASDTDSQGNGRTRQHVPSWADGEMGTLGTCQAEQKGGGSRGEGSQWSQLAAVPWSRGSERGPRTCCVRVTRVC